MAERSDANITMLDSTRSGIARERLPDFAKSRKTRMSSTLSARISRQKRRKNHRRFHSPNAKASVKRNPSIQSGEGWKIPVERYGPSVFMKRLAAAVTLSTAVVINMARCRQPENRYSSIASSESIVRSMKSVTNAVGKGEK